MLAADGVQERQEEDLLKPSHGTVITFEENCRILGVICCGDGWTRNAGRSNANRVRRRRQSEMRKILLGARWSRLSSSSGSGRELLWRGSQASHQQCLLSSDRNTQNSQRTRAAGTLVWDALDAEYFSLYPQFGEQGLLRASHIHGVHHNTECYGDSSLELPPQKNGMDNNPNCETYLHHIETDLTATKTFHLALTFWQCELVQQSL